MTAATPQSSPFPSPFPFTPSSPAMPIRYQWQHHDGRDLLCPVILCDTCGKQITDSADGYVDYRMDSLDDRAVSGEPYFTHRVSCMPEPIESGCGDTLDHFLDCLVNNTEHKYGSSKPVNI